MCVHTLLRKWRSWEMMTIVLERSLSTSSSQRIELMSRLLVGSSSSRMSGSANSACASSTRSFQPGATSLIGPLVQLGARCRRRAAARRRAPRPCSRRTRRTSTRARRRARSRPRSRPDWRRSRPSPRVTRHISRVAHQHDVEHADVLVGELVLRELAQALVRVERDVAARRTRGRRRGSSSTSTCRSRWRRSGRSGCRRRT